MPDPTVREECWSIWADSHSNLEAQIAAYVDDVKWNLRSLADGRPMITRILKAGDDAGYGSDIVDTIAFNRDPLAFVNAVLKDDSMVAPLTVFNYLNRDKYLDPDQVDDPNQVCPRIETACMGNHDDALLFIIDEMVARGITNYDNPATEALLDESGCNIGKAEARLALVYQAKQITAGYDPALFFTAPERSEGIREATIAEQIETAMTTGELDEGGFRDRIRERIRDTLLGAETFSEIGNRMRSNAQTAKSRMIAESGDSPVTFAKNDLKWISHGFLKGGHYEPTPAARARYVDRIHGDLGQKVIYGPEVLRQNALTFLTDSKVNGIEANVDKVLGGLITYAYLNQFRGKHYFKEGNVFIAHDDPANPGSREYLYLDKIDDARRSFRQFKDDAYLVFNAHTHHFARRVVGNKLWTNCGAVSGSREIKIPTSTHVIAHVYKPLEGNDPKTVVQERSIRDYDGHGEALRKRMRYHLLKGS